MVTILRTNSSGPPCGPTRPGWTPGACLRSAVNGVTARSALDAQPLPPPAPGARAAPSFAGRSVGCPPSSRKRDHPTRPCVARSLSLPSRSAQRIVAPHRLLGWSPLRDDGGRLTGPGAGAPGPRRALGRPSQPLAHAPRAGALGALRALGRASGLTSPPRHSSLYARCAWALVLRRGAERAPPPSSPARTGTALDAPADPAGCQLLAWMGIS